MTNARPSLFITGGGSGIGEAIAAHFVSVGWRVAIAGRQLSQLERVASTHRERSGQLTCFPLDVRDYEAIEQAIEAFGPTSLVCSAGILGRGTVWDELTSKRFSEVMNTNTSGTFNACRAAMLHWRKNKKPGDIVNISSLAGLRGMQKFEGFSAYAASKHAVVGLTEALALDGRTYDIRVNAVAPGAVATAMSKSLGISSSVTPEQIVPTIAFLLDRRQSGTTSGTTIEIHSNDF